MMNTHIFKASKLDENLTNSRLHNNRQQRSNKRLKKHPSTVIHVKITPLHTSQQLPVQLEKSSNQTPSYLRTPNVYMNQNDTAFDHHKSRKQLETKKYLRRCKFIPFITIFLLIGILLLLIILPIILLKKSEALLYNSTVLLRWNTTGITVAGITGNNSIDADKFNVPWDLTLVWPNTMYVTDRMNHRVQKCMLGSATCVTVAGQANGVFGATLNSLNKPTALLIDSNDNIYIADDNNCRVMLWSKNASSGTQIAGIGGFGSNLNQLTYPYGLANDRDFNMFFIADYTNHRIMKYLGNATSGTIAAGGNGRDINNTQLCLPRGIFFDDLSDSLLIANSGCHTIVNWKLGAANWTLLAGNINGTTGTTSTGLNSPSDVMLDLMGNMYVVDSSNHRIQFFLSGQKNGTTIAGITGTSGSNATLFNAPISLALDNQLNLYVTDSLNHRIQKFLRY